MSKNFFSDYKSEFIQTLNLISNTEFNNCVQLLRNLRNKKGRLFIIGVGGSSANASHAVNDFRKICNIEAYCPSDNVAELTARTNDDGFDFIFNNWLKTSNLKINDLLLIFSVGGGNLKKKVSINIINAIKFAKKKKVKSIAFIGKRDGYAFKNATLPILFKIKNKNFVTPISEAMQAALWHAVVTDPKLKFNKTKW